MKTIAPILMLLALAAGGCALGGGEPHNGPLTPVLTAPPGGYGIDTEPPGGSVAVVPPTEVPVARPVREGPPTVAGRLPTAVDPAGAVADLPPAGPPSTAGAATSEEQIVDAVLAEVNGEVITLEDILAPMRADMEKWRKTMGPEEYKDTCRYYIDLGLRKEISWRLVLQEANATLTDAEKQEIETSLGLPGKNPNESAVVERLVPRTAPGVLPVDKDKLRERDRLFIQRLLRQKVEPQIHVTHGELLAYYEKVKPERYEQPDKVHMALIVLKKSESADADHARALAEAVYERAVRGEDFAKLAATYSHDPMASKGGDWGLVSRGAFRIKAVDEAVFNLRSGQVGPVIETPEALYIVKAIERRTARTVPFTEVQGTIEQEVRTQKYNDAISKYIQQLYERAYVRIMPEK
jgi:hypothetical protein